MSGQADQEYFGDGIAEDIITALSRFRWFLVVSRTSSFIYKGRAVDIRTIGRELGVRYVLEGSVRTSNNRLRITAQLIEAATGNHLWAEKYDGAQSDVFDLQDKITEGIVGAIEPSVRQAEIERARRKRPESLDAYDLYLRALPHFWVNSTVESAKAVKLFEEALEIDPSFAPAHGYAALSYFHRFVRSGFDPAERAAASRHARAVVESKTDDANALALGGFVLAMVDHAYDAALGAIGKAIALNPNSSRAHTVWAAVNEILGRHDTAREAASHAIRLHPLDPMRYGPEAVLAFVYFDTGRYDEAAEAALRTLQSNPTFVHAHAMLAASYVKLNRITDAREAVRQLLELEPKFRAGAFRVSPVGPPDCMDALITALREAGMP